MIVKKMTLKDSSEVMNRNYDCITLIVLLLELTVKQYLFTLRTTDLHYLEAPFLF